MNNQHTLAIEDDTFVTANEDKNLITTASPSVQRIAERQVVPNDLHFK